MFKQASLKPSEPFTIINNRWKSSQLSTGDHPRPRGPVGSTAVLSLRCDNKKIRKQVAFWTATNFFGAMRWNIHFRGKCENIWQYQKLVIKFSLKHVRQRWKCSYPIFFRSPNCNCKRERNSNKVKNICFMLILHWSLHISPHDISKNTYYGRRT